MTQPIPIDSSLDVKQAAQEEKELYASLAGLMQRTDELTRELEREMAEVAKRVSALSLPEKRKAALFHRYLVSTYCGIIGSPILSSETALLVAKEVAGRMDTYKKVDEGIVHPKVDNFQTGTLIDW